jgi:hypothetical protein
LRIAAFHIDGNNRGVVQFCHKHEGVDDDGGRENMQMYFAGGAAAEELVFSCYNRSGVSGAKGDEFNVEILESRRINQTCGCANDKRKLFHHYVKNSLDEIEKAEVLIIAKKLETERFLNRAQINTLLS